MRGTGAEQASAGEVGNPSCLAAEVRRCAGRAGNFSGLSPGPDGGGGGTSVPGPPGQNAET